MVLDAPTDLAKYFMHPLLFCHGLSNFSSPSPGVLTPKSLLCLSEITKYLIDNCITRAYKQFQLTETAMEDDQAISRSTLMFWNRASSLQSC